MSKGTVQFLLTRLFSVGKIFGGKWGEHHDMKKAASATVLWLVTPEMFQRGKTNVLHVNPIETGGTQTKQFSSTLTQQLFLLVADLPQQNLAAV